MTYYGIRATVGTDYWFFEGKWHPFPIYPFDSKEAAALALFDVQPFYRDKAIVEEWKG